MKYTALLLFTLGFSYTTQAASHEADGAHKLLRTPSFGGYVASFDGDEDSAATLPRTPESIAATDESNGLSRTYSGWGTSVIADEVTPVDIKRLHPSKATLAKRREEREKDKYDSVEQKLKLARAVLLAKRRQAALHAEAAVSETNVYSLAVLLAKRREAKAALHAKATASTADFYAIFSRTMETLAEPGKPAKAKAQQEEQAKQTAARKALICKTYAESQSYLDSQR